MITRQDLVDLREVMQDDIQCVMDAVLGARLPGCVAVMVTASEVDELVTKLCQVVVDRVEPLIEGMDGGTVYHNFYCCSECGEEWENDADSECNDRCPQCNVEIEPYKSTGQ
jgi:transcription initiation factor IIE alpha subunit